jgi:asparagine synthase (glutamine-hydrolysing)
VYNYRELREENQLRCATQSDCEPPLHLYRRDGLSFVDGLRGMYAIALHDRATRRLVLARDPFGIKPLYTAEVPGGLAFASEPQALIAAGLVQPRLRPEAVEELLQLQFTTGAETIFAGIHRVCRARRCPSPMAASPSAAAARRCPRAGRKPSPRPRRFPASTRRWRKAWRCTSAPTCPMACSCPAARTARRSSP